MSDHQDALIQILETRKTLLEERELLLDKARNIAAKCNSVVPISKLPAEILLRIFTSNAFSANEDRPPYYRESSQYVDSSRDARRAGQVCQYWRQLALGSPTLWSLLLNCNFVPPLWAAELVRRSGSLPLKLTINFFSNHIRKSATNFRAALPHFHRLGELEAFCGDIKNVKDILFKRLRQPMPTLHSLTLSSGDYEAEEREEVDDLESFTSDASNYEVMLRDRNPYLPPFPFEESCQLSRLKTSGYLFRLDSPLYRHLVELAIFNVAGKVPKVSEWCTLIRTLESLNSLTLVDAFSKADDDEPMQDMELYRLRYLKMTGPFRPCSHLLLHISAPALHTFDLRIRSVNFHNPLADHLMDAILLHLYRQKGFASPKSLRTIVSKRSIAITDIDAGTTAPLLFRVHLGYSQSLSREFCEYLIPSLKSRVGTEPFGSLECGGSRYPPIMVQNLIALMAPYASTPDLRISFEMWGTFLMPLLQGFADNERAAPLFPLSLTHIHNITIRAMAWHVNRACEGLSKFVVWRHGPGDNPLETVHFKNSEVHSTPTMPPACRDLEPFCGTIRWEGRRNRNHRRYTSDLSSDDSMVDGLYGDEDEAGW